MYTSFHRFHRRHELTAESITYHTEPYHKFLKKYEQLVEREVMPTGEIPQEIQDKLHQYIGHSENLRIAWDYLAQHGGQAPGRNGMRYRDLSNGETWDLVRHVSRSLKSGSYRPGPERTVEIPKSSGTGTRTLRILNIEDRVVQRAILQILQPLVDPTFSSLSFGYRPRRDRRHALAMAKRLTQAQELRTWLVDDIANCYDQIPCQRLLQILGTRLPENIVRLVELTCTGKRKRGVRQGSPLSALLVNVYLDHIVDRPWERQHPETPLLRTADDILVLAASHEQAENLYADLSQRLRSAGVSLKGHRDTAICDLERGDKATWLGFVIAATNNDLTIDLADRSWRKLAEAFGRAHEKPLAARVADQIVTGWLAQAAPCHVTSSLSNLIERVRDLAREYGFEELQANWWFETHWANAVAAWQQIQVHPEASGTAGENEAFGCTCAYEDDAPF